MPNKSETKSYGSIRKYKRFGACGVILGMAALSLSMNPNVAHADEKVNPNPATNAIPLQDNPTANATESQKKTGTEKGSLDVTVNHDKLDKAVKDAKTAGVTVVEAPAKEKTVASDKVKEAKAEVEADYKAQETKVKETTDKYKEEVAKRDNKVKIIEKKNEAAEAKYKEDLQKALENNKQIEKENKDSEAKYNKDLETVNKENEKIRKENDEAQKLYYKQLNDVETSNKEIDQKNQALKDEYNQKLKKYSEGLERYKKELETFKTKETEVKKKGLLIENKDVSIYGNVDESKRGTLDYYSGLTAVFKEGGNTETVKGALGATSATTLELVDKIKVDTERERIFNAEKGAGYIEKYGGHVLTDIQKGSTFILHNVGKTNTGKTISAKFVSRSTPTPEFPLNEVNRGSKTSLWVWWYKDKPVSEVGFNPYNYLNNEWDIEYFDEVTKKPINLGSISIYSDIDYRQAVRHTYNDDHNLGVVINRPDSLVRRTQVNGKDVWMGIKTNGVHESPDQTGLNRWQVGDPFYVDVNDAKDTPEGTIVSAGVGSVHHLTYYSDYTSARRDGYSPSQMMSYRQFYDSERRVKGEPYYSDEELFRAGYAFQLWGGRSVIEKLTPPPKPTGPEEPKLLEKPKNNIVKPTPKPEKELPKKDPKKPYLPIPVPPETEAIPPRVETPTVNVQYTNLKTNVKIEKHVKNSKGEDVNNHSVPKLAEVVWELEAKPLAAGREETTVLQYTDDLPKGYQLDVAKTQTQNPEFDVKYNSATHSLVGTLKAEGLAKANKDRNVAYTVPTLKLYGTVMNDAATYTNNYHLNVNNKFDVYSNTVTVTTPGDPNRPKDSQIKPVKVNYNKDHVKIDGKQVLAGSTNYYHINLDYDQYKGIKSGPDAIQKGFGAVDDYPEQALDLLPNQIKYVETESGKEVKGITAYQFKSIEEVKDPRIKAILDSSKIKPKGAFQVFMADNPQEFYDKYVSKGISVTIIDPMKVKSAFSGNYENKAYQIDFGNGYEADLVKNNVVTPEPHKKNLNSKGVDINGKPVVAESVNHYHVTADYSKYKGMVVEKDRLAKGLFVVDDYPEQAVDIETGNIKIVDSKGKTVEGVTSKVYKSLEEAPKLVQDALKEQGFKPKGAFQVFTPNDMNDYFNKYVVTGEKLTYIVPMKVKAEMAKTGGKYENTAYQLDFGLAKVTETVVNKVVKPTPKKANFNKAGVNIDGKQVFAGSINYYHVTADYSQYKGIQADKSRIAQGFFIADDYPEDVLDVLSDGIKLSDSKGQDVKGLKYHVYESIEKAPEVLRKALTERGFKPKGAFQVWEAENPAEFYAKYVQTGDTITIINPMKVKEKFSKTGGKYENTAYQVDFGVAEVTVTVVNNIPKFETKKDVVIKVGDTESKDGKEIVLGQKFFYSFDGSLITANRAEDLFEYKFVDDYQETHDRFDGVYKVIAKKDFKTSDGKTFKKGDDLTSYSFLKEDKTKGKLEVGLKEEFLRSITNDSEFQAEVFVEMTRIKSGEVENKQTHVVNGVEVESNTVKTTTPEPPKTPETPTPKPQTPAKKVLPNTGADVSMLGIVMAGITSALGAIGLKRKRD